MLAVAQHAVDQDVLCSGSHEAGRVAQRFLRQANFFACLDLGLDLLQVGIRQNVADLVVEVAVHRGVDQVLDRLVVAL